MRRLDDITNSMDFEQTQGDSEGQGSFGVTESDTTGQLNNNNKCMLESVCSSL